MINRAERLDGVHVDLMKVIIHAGTKKDFTVLQGLRTIEEQRQLVAAGKSQTLKSRHLTGHAVDLCIMRNGVACWDFAEYKVLADTVKEAAKEVGIPIEWGGDWKTFKDGPHFQLPESRYPDIVSA